MANTLAYFLDGKIYINLTNNCTNNCIFCLRAEKSDVCGQEMWLDNENFSAKDVEKQLIEQFKKYPEVDETVFCGYGEPTLKLDILKEVAKFIKTNYPKMKVRINTNGTANIIYKRNIVPELKGLIDTISVSLNAENENLYNELSQPTLKNTYEEVKKFIKEVSDSGIEAVSTIVTGYKNYKINIEECKKISNSLGAKFREREFIENGYS